MFCKTTLAQPRESFTSHNVVIVPVKSKKYLIILSVYLPFLFVGISFLVVSISILVVSLPFLIVSISATQIVQTYQPQF